MKDGIQITRNKSNSDIYLLDMSDSGEYECHIFNGLIFIPKKGCEPNWFHMKMQELCFGFKWRKRKKVSIY